MTRGTRNACFAACIALILPAAVVAQQTAASDSSRRDSLRLYRLPPLAATATRIPASPAETGFPTATLERRALLAEPTTRASRALTFLPGAAIEEGSGPGGPAVLHLRGAGEPYTQMLFDGVAINISGGFNDIAGLLMTNVDRIEVARGPLSALWGSSAMAGAVQFLTHEGEAGPTRFAVLLEGGGAATHGGEGRSEITASGGGERLRWSAGAGGAYDRGIYAVPTDLATGDASLRLDAHPSDRWDLTATARYIAIQANLPVRDAGVTRVPLDPNQRDRHHRWLGSLSAGFAATPSWHQRVTASLLRDEFVYEDTHDSLPGAYPFFVFNYNFHFRSVLLRPGLEYVGTHEVAAGAAHVAFSYGARWQRETETNDQAGDFGPSHMVLGRANSALFTELQGRWGPRLSALVGARLEKFAGLRAELLPRAGLVFAVVPERFSLRASAGRSFKAPNVDQQYLATPSTVPNPALRPEHSASWEVAAIFTGPSRAASLSVGYFHQDFDGLIATVAADTGSKQTNKNVGRTRSEGVEVSLERRWSLRWSGGADVTWVRTAVLDNTGLSAVDYPVGGALPATPRLTGNAFISGDLSDAFSALARVTLVGRQVVLTERFSGQRVASPAYALAELVLQWHASRAFTVYMRCGNLFDAHYLTAFDRPGVPRNVSVGMRLAP